MGRTRSKTASRNAAVKRALSALTRTTQASWELLSKL